MIHSKFYGIYDDANLVVDIKPNGHWKPTTVHDEITTLTRTVDYGIFSHFHPFVDELVRRLELGGVAGLQDADTAFRDGELRPELRDEDYFERDYQPNPELVTHTPIKQLDFGVRDPYALYNWELFFHVPVAIATQLSRSGRHAEAQRWFHYVFDPTDDSDGEAPARFWKFEPFRRGDVELIEAQLHNLSTGDDPDQQYETVRAIEAWKSNPFSPHLVARHRPTAYKLAVVMAYLDNLIAWGDELFRQYTVESIVEATQLYVLAANILGPRPRAKPGAERSARSYAELREQRDALGNVLVARETEIPFDQFGGPSGSSVDAGQSVTRSIGETLYFCVPHNQKLLRYWDLVGDRLFKIHNSLDLDGRLRELPLFEPPIAPGLLAAARAAGVDVRAVVSGAGPLPMPRVRFRILLREARDLCRQVQGLGAQLLAAIEKQDAEALSLLRSRQERALLERGRALRYQQLQEAIKQREIVEGSRRAAIESYVEHERLLGRTSRDIRARLTDLGALDVEGLDAERFDGAPDPELGRRPLPIHPARGKPGLSRLEAAELDAVVDAQQLRYAAIGTDGIAMALRAIPQLTIAGQPMGVGVNVTTSGRDIAALPAFAAHLMRAWANHRDFEAGMSGRRASYERRTQQWIQASNAAVAEINSLTKQLRAAQIREHIAGRELELQDQQIADAEAIEQFMTDERRGKLTNEAFYLWMRDQCRGLYRRCFELAFSVAKQAEMALRAELDTLETGAFIGEHYLVGREGLLAGEKLELDLAEMERAFWAHERPEFELRKQVSLRQLDPGALLELRATGECRFALPESLFDLDGSGHYLRRLRSVAVSLPCVTGPHASVSVTLTLTGSQIRTSAALDDGQPYADGLVRGPDCARSVIATSTSVRDPGVFEARDEERPQPFEGAGAVSSWHLQLPADPRTDQPRAFDYDTISDVVLHLELTAHAGAELRTRALAELEAVVRAGQHPACTRMFALAEDFPAAWSAFVAGEGPGVLALELDRAHFAFPASQIEPRLHSIELIAAATTDVDVVLRSGSFTTGFVLGPSARFGALREGGVELTADRPSALAPLSLELERGAIDELWLLLRWGE